jgi:hypothetical protein
MHIVIDYLIVILYCAVKRLNAAFPVCEASNLHLPRCFATNFPAEILQFAGVSTYQETFSFASVFIGSTADFPD